MKEVTSGIENLTINNIDSLFTGSTAEILLKVGEYIKIKANIHKKNNNEESLLCLAVQNANTDVTNLLVDAGADVNFINNKGENLLYIAVTRGNIDIVQKLLAAGANRLHQTKDGKTALHLAAFLSNKEEIAKALIENAGDSLDIVNDQGDTALHFATKTRNEIVIETLLKAGANVNIVNKQNHNSLILAAPRSGEDQKNIQKTYRIIDLLKQYGAVDEKSCILHTMAAENSAADLKKTIEEHPEIDIDTKDSHGFTPLFTAALHNQIDNVKVLIEAEANMNLKNNAGYTAVYIATKLGHIETIRLLLKAGAYSYLADADGNTALHMAALNGCSYGEKKLFADYTEIVDILLEYNADIEAKGKVGTPLHAAVMHGDKEIIQKLLNVGANILSTDKNGNTALHLAAYMPNKEEIAKTLIENAGDSLDIANEQGDTALHLATKARNQIVVEALLEAGANVKLINKQHQDAYALLKFRNGEDAESIQKACWISFLLMKLGAVDKEKGCILHSMAAGRPAANFQMMIDMAPEIDINTKDSKGFTPLHIATLNNRIDNVKVLIGAGADINLQSNDGLNALHVAAKLGNASITKLLLKKGSDRYLTDVNGYTALHMAAMGGYMDGVKTIFEDYAPVVDILLKYEANIEATDNAQETPLHVAVRAGSQNMVKKLLDAGANILSIDKDGDNAVHKACSQGYTEIVDILVNYRANIEGTNNQGETPLYMAFENDNKKMVEKLLAVGANILSMNKYGENMLHIACGQGNEKILDTLLSKYRFDAKLRTHKGDNALHFAAMSGSKVIAQKLLNAGIDINSQNNVGYTPLHAAILYSNMQEKNKEAQEELIKFFIEKGANINLSASFLFSTIALSTLDSLNLEGTESSNIDIKKNADKIVKKLIDLGLNINLKYPLGNTALHWAVIFNRKDLVKLFISKGANLSIKNDDGKTVLNLAIENHHNEIAALLTPKTTQVRYITEIKYDNEVLNHQKSFYSFGPFKQQMQHCHA
jgi:ankyrin repeat protein